jgi:hypothetical protein
VRRIFDAIMAARKTRARLRQHAAGDLAAFPFRDKCL